MPCECYRDGIASGRVFWHMYGELHLNLVAYKKQPSQKCIFHQTLQEAINDAESEFQQSVSNGEWQRYSPALFL